MAARKKKGKKEKREVCFAVQVVVVAWVIATVFFLITYTSPCLKLPPPNQLKYFELGGSDQDIFSGVDDTDARGLKHFPRLWCEIDLALCYYYYYYTLFLPEVRCVCRQAAVKAAKILPLDGLARSKQDPINRGHGAQYLYRPMPAWAGIGFVLLKTRKILTANHRSHASGSSTEQSICITRRHF